MTFAVLYTPGPSWVAGRPLHEQDVAKHLEYMGQLQAQGIVLMGGPFTGEDRGLVILEVPGDNEAREVVARDPAVLNGVLKAEWHPWATG
jgi:uncharacterized protein YciI